MSLILLAAFTHTHIHMSLQSILQYINRNMENVGVGMKGSMEANVKVVMEVGRIEVDLEVKWK